MKIKVSETTNTQIDWLVAKIEGMHWLFEVGGVGSPPGASYSTDWAQGGPIIEREKIELIPLWLNSNFEGYAASHRSSIKYDEDGEFIDGSDCKQYDQTPLIAAMRCFCCSRLGEIVDVPNGMRE